MKIRIIIALLCLVFVNACLEDKTNLDYSDVILPDTVRVVDKVNEKSVLLSHSTLYQGSFSWLSGVEAHLEAEVVYAGDETLTYEWQFDGVTIGSEKELKHIFTQNGRLVLLISRGDRTKVSDYHMLVNLTQPFGSGVYVLAKHEGKTVLDFMRYYTQRESLTFLGSALEMNIGYYEEVSDVFPLFNNDEELKGTDPVKLVWGQGKDKTQVLQLLDRDWKNSVAIYGKTLEKVVGMEDEFVGTPENLKVKDMINVGATTLLYGEEGDAYVRVNYDGATPNTGRFTSQRFRYNDPGDVPDLGWMDVSVNMAVPDKQVSNNWAFLHEKDKKRFLFFSVSSVFMPDDTGGVEYSVAVPFPEVSLKENQVGLHNFDKEVVAVFPPISALYPATHIIYKDGEDYRIQAHSITQSIYSIPHTVRYSISGNTLLPPEVAALLSKPGAFLLKNQTTSRQEFFYIISGNTIHEMNANGGNLTLVYAFEAGRKITKFFRLSPWTAPTGNASAQYFTGRLFAVAFDNGDFKIGRFYNDPMEPGVEKCSYLIEKNYDGGVSDIKFIYSNVIM